jgi:hypothetical protein
VGSLAGAVWGKVEGERLNRVVGLWCARFMPDYGSLMACLACFEGQTGARISGRQRQRAEGFPSAAARARARIP